MKTPKEIFDLLDARRIELGLSQSEVGRRAFGQTDGSALQNIKRGSSPTIDRLDAIANVLGLEVYFGPKRETSNPEPALAADSDYKRVPIHAASLSAGPGAQNGDAGIIDHLVFKSEWLSRNGVMADTAVMARIVGESMSPGIQPGDIVLIDTSKREIGIRRRIKGSPVAPIYAFIQDNEARVKRIERPEANLLVLLSDNPAYPPEVVTIGRSINLEILGQVVWSGHIWR